MERVRVGFKTQAIIKQEALEQENNPPQLVGEEMVSVSPVVAETINRLENLNSFIMSKEFSKLTADNKQAVLNDFAYISQIASII